MEKLYHGLRTEGGCRVWVVVTHGDSYALPMRTDLRYHSADFEWGYGGSGPAQLALALLADVLGNDQRAHDLHQHFKWDVVLKLGQDEWEMTEHEIRAWAGRQGQDEMTSN